MVVATALATSHNPTAIIIKANISVYLWKHLVTPKAKHKTIRVIKNGNVIILDAYWHFAPIVTVPAGHSL